LIGRSVEVTIRQSTKKTRDEFCPGFSIIARSLKRLDEFNSIVKTFCMCLCRRFFAYFTHKPISVKPISALLLFILFSPLQPVMAQSNDTGIARIITNIRQLHELNPSEKCFLHTDKQFYQPGETVWFKTYFTVNDLPITLSNVVYTDFSDLNGKLYAKAMWKAEQGTANGNIYIPDSLKTGIYRVRSYSLWMLNEPSSISEQYIFILGKMDQTKSFDLPAKSVSVHFFPESGSLIESMENNLAFRITDDNQQPVREATIEVQDETKKRIAAAAVFANGKAIA
jgi:MG2 domain